MLLRILRLLYIIPGILAHNVSLTLSAIPSRTATLPRALRRPRPSVEAADWSSDHFHRVRYLVPRRQRRRYFAAFGGRRGLRRTADAPWRNICRLGGIEPGLAPGCRRIAAPPAVVVAVVVDSRLGVLRNRLAVEAVGGGEFAGARG